MLKKMSLAAATFGAAALLNFADAAPAAPDGGLAGSSGNAIVKVQNNKKLKQMKAVKKGGPRVHRHAGHRHVHRHGHRHMHRHGHRHGGGGGGGAAALGVGLEILGTILEMQEND
jgi:hypothetical protein